MFEIFKRCFTSFALSLERENVASKQKSQSRLPLVIADEHAVEALKLYGPINPFLTGVNVDCYAFEIKVFNDTIPSADIDSVAYS